MGVLGLWEVLESVGHPIKIEGLEGKVLGVDANIWLYKFIRGFREKDNATSIESHKLGLFNRVAKLLYYRIKPVFVFDGPAPVLKRRTLERRQNTRNKHLVKVQDAALKILASQLKSQYPDAKIDDIKITMPNLVSNNLVAAEKLTEEDRDLFYLPEVAKTKDSDSEDSDFSPDVFIPHEYVQTEVDIQSKDFTHLPAETRYEILHDIKQARRRIRNPNHLPEDANSFSNFQLERLKARRNIQEKIEQCEKEICTNYTGELADGSSIQAYRVQSDSRATILYRNNTYDPRLLEASSSETSIKHEEEVVKDETKDKEATTGDISRISHQTSQSQPESSRYTKSDDRASFEEIISDETTDEESLSAHSIRTSPHASRSRLESFQGTRYVKNGTKDSIESEEKIIDGDTTDDTETDDESLVSESEGTSQQANDSKAQRSLDSSFDVASSTGNNMDKTVIEIIDLVESNNANTTITIDSSLDDSDSSVDTSTEQTIVGSQHVNLSPLAHTVNDSQSTITTDTTQHDATLKAHDMIMTANLINPPDRSNPSSQANPVGQIEERCQKSSIATDVSAGQTNQFNLVDQNDPTDEETTQEPKVLHTPQNSQPLQSSQTTKLTQSSQVSEISSQGTIKHSSNATNRVTHKIIEDAKELLRLFGIPYIDAAGEAEAQCAKLEELKLTEGTITDDSDIWLFGSQNVYRHFFSDDKYVMQYKMTDIEFHIRMTRENLVCFAMLVGSDYTDGIMNIGAVTALEVLSEFPGEGMDPLIQFRDWHREATRDLKAAKKDKSRKKLLKYRLPEEFPSRAVYDGYLRPVADASAEKFTWGVPELDELREYARRNFGWDPKKVDDKLVPVMKRLNEKKLQKTIDTFFFKTEVSRNPEMFRSKRVNQALNKIAKRAARGGETSMPEVVNLSEDED